MRVIQQIKARNPKFKRNQCSKIKKILITPEETYVMRSQLRWSRRSECWSRL